MAEESLSMQHDAENGVVTVLRGDVPVYRQPLRLPTDIQLRVLDEGSFRITDGREVGFSTWLSSTYYDALTISSPTETPLGVRFSYELREMSGDKPSVESADAGDLQQFIDDLVSQSDFRAEGPAMLHFPKGDLLVKGPDRDGRYQLSSGMSTLVYEPETGIVSPGFRWARGSRVTAGSLELGNLLLEMPFGPDRVLRHELRILFGNTDPSKSYEANKL